MRSNDGYSLQLVPPSLGAIAALITRKKEIRYSVDRLIDKCFMGISFVQLRLAGMPLVKVATSSLGSGLTIALPQCQDESGMTSLVWISELACHPMCAFLGRICQGNLSSFEWLEKIEKKHLEWLDKLPTV